MHQRNPGLPLDLEVVAWTVRQLFRVRKNAATKARSLEQRMALRVVSVTSRIETGSPPVSRVHGPPSTMSRCRPLMVSATNIRD
jgi:hypothetical protein